MSSHFKDKKFTGDIQQSIDMTIRDYNISARQHKLSRRQKADFFSIVFEGAARTFFFNNAREDMAFEELVDLMVKEYNSDARQLQVQRRLENLRLETFMADDGITDWSGGPDTTGGTYRPPHAAVPTAVPI